MRKNSAKVRKNKICAKIAQILRKRFSHFVETLGLEENLKVMSLLLNTLQTLVYVGINLNVCFNIIQGYLDIIKDNKF